MKIVHLLSGGLDSTVMLYDLLDRQHQVHCILFNYGQRHAVELRYARATCQRLSVTFDEVELARIKNLFLRCALTDGRSSDVVVPNRNAVFLNIACAMAESLWACRVTFGATAEDFDRFPDCRTKWISSLNRTLAAAELRVRVSAPYATLSKRQIVSIGNRLGVPFESTMSCYNGNNCGKCLACKTRKKALCGQ